MGVRKSYRRKNGVYVKGTFVKPKYFKKQLAVDLDFHTRAIRDKKTGELKGRNKVYKRYERSAIIRLPSGELAGRTQILSIPYPKTYPISTRQKRIIKTKRIPVIHWD